MVQQPGWRERGPISLSHSIPWLPWSPHPCSLHAITHRAPHLCTPGHFSPAGSEATRTARCSRAQVTWVRASTREDVRGPGRAGGPTPHLESGDDPLASMLEKVLIRPGGVCFGQRCSQVVVVPKPGDALSLQEGVLIPPGTPQVCKSRRDHQWGMLPLGLDLPVAGGAPPALWLQPSIPSSPRSSSLPRVTSSLSE